MFLSLQGLRFHLLPHF